MIQQRLPLVYLLSNMRLFCPSPSVRLSYERLMNEVKATTSIR